MAKEDLDWKKTYSEAVELYKKSEYSAAFAKIDDAVVFLEEAHTMVLRQRMWSARFAGLKNPAVRAEAYEIARWDARLILSMSKILEIRNSAIKLLILLPGEDVKELCRMGIDELQRAQNVGITTEANAGDLIAELKNSLGSAIKNEDPEGALKIFLEAYDLLSKKDTTLAGHLMQNAGTCRLMLADIEKDESRRLAHLEKAKEYLGKALENYPRDQVAHRTSTEKKLADAMDKAKQINRER